MSELPGKDLAAELIRKSRDAGRETPMEEVIKAARAGTLNEEAEFRLVCRLWSVERMLYYVYGGWGQGLELNDHPPGVKYLFARQIMDDSTHEMTYVDLMLRRGWISSQGEAFDHPYGKFVMNSALASLVFSLRYLASYPHRVRIASVNLGLKVIELAWMEALAEALPDAELASVFTSQFVENRSHVNMGRRIVEECVSTPFEMELCRRVNSTVTRDYTRFLAELSNTVLQRKVAEESHAKRATLLRIAD